MVTKTLRVEISEELYKKFFTVVVEKGGRWRRKETALKAFRSAVEVALIKFLEGLETPSEEKGKMEDSRKVIIGIPIQPISNEEIIVAFCEMLERTITGVVTLLVADNPEDEEKGYRILEQSIDAGKRLETLARSSLGKVKVLGVNMKRHPEGTRKERANE